MESSNTTKCLPEFRFARYVIPGDPIPWKRAGNNAGRYFDMQARVKRDMGIVLASQHEGALFGRALQMDIVFYMPIPKTSAKRTALLCGTPHYSKPDISNLIKLFEDAATGIIYGDDRLIAVCHAKKVYDTSPRTEVYIEEVWSL